MDTKLHREKSPEKCDGLTRFGVLAREVFSWDAAIRWIALDDPGRRPHLEWRDPDSRLAAAATTPPLLLMLAESRQDIYNGGTSAGPRDLRFVVLAYRDRAQAVTRFGRYGYVNIGVSSAADTYSGGNPVRRIA